MIKRVIKSKHNVWRSTLTAMIREDVHSFGLGAPSIYVKYHRRSAVALVTSLEDPSERHQSVTVHLLTHQVAQLKALATTFLSTREGTSLPIKRQLSLYMRARQLACIQASKLHLALKGNSMFLEDLKLRSHLRPQAPPPNINHPHQLHHQTAYGPRHNWLPRPHISQRGIHCLWETTQKQVCTLEFSKSTS